MFGTQKDTNDISNIAQCVFSSIYENCITGVMVRVLAESVVDLLFEPRSGHTEEYKIGIYCFSA